MIYNFCFERKFVIKVRDGITPKFVVTWKNWKLAIETKFCVVDMGKNFYLKIIWIFLEIEQFHVERVEFRVTEPKIKKAPLSNRMLFCAKLSKSRKNLKFYSVNIDKILVANRGEIACRIIKTAKKMGIRLVTEVVIDFFFSHHTSIWLIFIY